MRFLNFNWLSRAYNLGLSFREVAALIVLSLIATVTEVFGIGMFLPIFQFIRLEGDLDALVSNSSLWQYAINTFSYFRIETSLVALLILSFSFFIGRQVFTYFRLIYSTVVRQRIMQKIRKRVFSSYIDANTSYHDSMPVGNLVNTITTEVNHAVIGLMAPVELIVYIIMLIGYISVLFILSWEMTLISAIILILASRIPNIWIKKSAQTGRKLVNANTIMSEFLVGRLRSPRLVRLAGTEMAEKNEFHKLTQEQRKHSVFGSILQARAEVSMEPIVIGLSMIFLYFAYTAMNLQIEIIGLYLVVALRLLPIVKSIISQWQTVQRLIGSTEVIEMRLKEMKNSFEKNTGSKKLNALKQSIKLTNVSYRYPNGSDNTLKNITIEIKSNEMNAIVGPSGGGKSTLIDLLPRLRLPTEGAIQIDNLDIEGYTLKSLRENISYVPQSPQIFNGTVSDHVLYGKVDATNEELQDATRLAGAYDFINQLPHGFDTVLGDDAIRLSGGQRQRLDLARALVGKKPILILDEPTSNLDAESENIFKNTMHEIHKKTNTTIIVIAHRLASIYDSDQIIVLNNGVVESTGVHSELIKQNGWYSKAWKMQESSL